MFLRSSENRLSWQVYILVMKPITLVLCAASAFINPLSSQVSTVDEGAFSITVNGERVGEGDVVASFRVSRIEARRIIVEREGIRLEIQMK